MENQPERSRGLSEKHRREILTACRSLYESEGFKSVTLKRISERVSFTRPLIYRYYHSKGEIFIDILTEELLSWVGGLEEAFGSERIMTRREYCRRLAETLIDRENMLSLFPYFVIIRDDCRVERLADFLSVFKKVENILENSLGRYFRLASPETKKLFLEEFFVWVKGIYSATHATEVERQALHLAGFPKEKSFPFEELCRHGIATLASSL